MSEARHRWQTLTVTTLGILLATVNSSTVLIALPAIFRGLHLDPLRPGNVSYLLWMLLGYLVVTAVFVVLAGRLGDMYGRSRMYTLGFAVFTVAAAACALVPGTGGDAALAIIVLRCVQGAGGSLMMANSTAILIDVFPPRQRGMAIGVNQVFAVAGSFLGLVLGGLLAEWSWRSVFWVLVPLGVLGTLWSRAVLVDVRARLRIDLDLPGTVTFAAGLVAVLVAITYGLQPYRGHDTGWTNPWVFGTFAGGLALLALFALIERRAKHPMFDLGLFRIRTFASGNIAGLLASISRGGLQFMLIIWLQGIWLPLHGYDFASTPLWAAIYLLPLTAGFLVAGPVSGALSDRYGSRGLATVGMAVTATSFGLFLLLPTDFPYWAFAATLLVSGVGTGMFTSPNTTAIMNAVPPGERGVASGMRFTFQNSGMVLSMGLFFTLLVLGLSSSLPTALGSGLTAHHVPAATAHAVAAAPPVASLFAAFLGYNPMQQFLGPQVLAGLQPADAAYLTGPRYFPQVMSGPFHHGLAIVFTMSMLMCLVAAVASWLRGGGSFVHEYEHGHRREHPPATRPESRQGGVSAELPAEPAEV